MRPVFALVLISLLVLSIPSAQAAVPHENHHSSEYEVDLLGGQIEEVQRSSRTNAALDGQSEWQGFLQRNPGWVSSWDANQAMPTRLQGPALPLEEIPRSPASAERLGRQFLLNQAAAWVTAEQLSPVRTVESPTGWWVQYAQLHEGLRVVDGRSYLRISKNGTVPLFGVDFYRNVSSDVVATVSEAQALRAAIGDFASDIDLQPRETELVILPEELRGETVFRLVYEIEFSSNQPAGDWLAYVDAKSGQLLKRKNRVHYTDVAGQTNADVELLQSGDPQQRRSIRYADLFLKDGDDTIAKTSSDVNGSYALTPEVDGTYTLVAPLAGDFGVVMNNTNGDATPELTFIVDSSLGGAQSVTWTDSNSLVQDRDAYYWAMFSLDYIKAVDPAFDLLDYPMPIVTDLIDNECNAFWNGIGITFYPEGPRCTNTARSASVVIHEYGHGVTALSYRPFAPSGAMHEGFSDYFSATILNDPIIGHGFNGPGTSIRNIEPDRRAPDDIIGQVHTDGLIIAGALWDVRKELGSALTDQLFHFARFGYSDNFDDYFFDFLIEDDDDGNVYNGTPNFAVIVDNFKLHGIGDYSINVSHQKLKDSEDTSKSFDFTASFLSIFQIDAATVELHIETERDGSTTAETHTMTATGGVREFTYNLGPQMEGTEVRYWFTSADTTGTTSTYPEGGAADPFIFRVGTDVTPPTITHTPLSDQPVDHDGIPIGAEVSDNLELGVGDVLVAFTQNELDSDKFELLPLSGDRYAGEFSLKAWDVGDVIAYSLSAEDLASVANMALNPEKGEYTFEIVQGWGRNFETTDGGIVAEGAVWEWGEPSFFMESGASGSKAWVTNADGPYNNNASGLFTVGPVDLSTWDKAVLRFNHAYDIEPDWDGGNVEVSVNGIDWEVITPDGDYPFGFIFSLAQPGYAGRQSEWVPAEFDLTSFLGESSVWFRFNFASDTGLTGPGWFVDDIQVLENQALALPLQVAAVSGRNALVPVSWDSPGGVPTDETSPILGYTVYRTEDQEIWTKLNKELLSDTEFLDDTALNGNFYDYAVTATYEDGESPLSDFATAIPYVAGYESNTTAIAAQLDEGDSEVQTLSLTNDGTGFLQMNIFEAGPDHVLDDIRIRFDFPDPIASKGGVLGQAQAALPEVSESVSINSDVSDQLRKAYMEAMGISAADVKASGSVEKPSSREVVKFKAIPPTGSYVDVFTDPSDLAVPGFIDIKDIGFQFEDGSFYVRVTSHQVWGSFQGFNLSISFDVDQNPDTGGFVGDYLLLVGAIPINNPNIGAPAVLLDGNFNIVGFPHHLIQQDNTDEAEWGFFASTINAGNSMYVSATTLAPNGQIPLDSAPDGVNISWIGREATHYEVFQQASVDVPINLVADLAPATYTAQLLVETNDPTAREVAIPVSLQVDEVVPVRLLAFDASSGDLGVNLKWKTAEEIDHLGFHVYRRTGAEETEVRLNEDLVLARRAGEYVFEDRNVVPGETYSYRLGDMSRDGSIRFHSPVAIRFAGTELLGAPVLRQSSPNPLVSATSIRFGLPEQDRVSLAIYSITGQRVRVLAQNESFGDGFHEVPWDGRDEAGRRVAAGVYTYRLQTSRSVMQQKLVVVR